MADEQNQPNLDAIVAGLVAKHGGDAAKALAKLVDENHDLREKNRGLKADLTAAQAKAPAEGAVVLSGDDATAWAAYTALGAPADLTKQLDDAKAATGRLAALEREQVVTKAATAAGYKPAVLLDLAAAKGFDVEVKSETVEGTAADVAYAVPKGADGKPGQPVKLADYVTQHLADYVPALTAAPTTPPPVRPAPQYPASRGTGTPPSGNAIDDVLAKNQERAKAPNALRPAKAA